MVVLSTGGVPTQYPAVTIVNADGTSYESRAARVIAHTSTPVQIINTAAESTLISFATPTGLVAGDRLILRAGGNILNNSGGSVTYLFRFKIGVTTVIASNAVTLTTGSGARKWMVEGVIAVASLTSQLMSILGTITPTGADSMTWSSSPISAAGTGTAAENLTTSQNVVMTIAMGTAAAAADITLQQASLALLPKHSV